MRVLEDDVQRDRLALGFGGLGGWNPQRHLVARGEAKVRVLRGAPAHARGALLDQRLDARARNMRGGDLLAGGEEAVQPRAGLLLPHGEDKIRRAVPQRAGFNERHQYSCPFPARLVLLATLHRTDQEGPNISADAPFCAVIGAGPAGLIATDVLSRAGARVVVFEHKPSPARKFLMAGRGGLNLTHGEPLEVFLTRYGAAARDLEPIIRAFPPERLRQFSAELGEETFIGSSGRVFPKSFKASPLLRALLTRLAERGVRFERAAFEGFVGDDALSIKEPAGQSTTLAPGAAVLALGGASWPRLGSDGGWVEPFRAAGISIAPLAPANCGALIGWSAHFRDAFEGQPIKTVLLRAGAATARGDIVVTRAGLEGGPAYALASGLRETLARDRRATLEVDLRPDASVADLTRRLDRDRAKQSLATFLRKSAKLGKIEIALLREASPEGLPLEAEGLAALIKNAPLSVDGVAGFDRAISTAGGVKFDELDAALMLKRRPGVFLAGEMLDFDAPTGGYLLQAAFSTGYVAGRGAAAFLGLDPELASGNDPR